MARFTQINKVDNTYKPVSFDLTPQSNVRYNQLKDEEKQNITAIESDNLAKLKYKELLSKVRLQDYHKAEKMLDEYTLKKANEVAGAKDHLNLAEAVNSNTNFTSNSEWSKMANDYEKEQAIIEKRDAAQAQGKNVIILNDDPLNQSAYNEKTGEREGFAIRQAGGTARQGTMNDLQLSEVKDYAGEMNTLVKNNVKPDGVTWEGISKLDGSIITYKNTSIGKEKLRKIARNLLPAWLGSDSGKAQLAQLTTSTNNNRILTEAEAIEVITKQLEKQALNHIESDTNDIRARDNNLNSNGSKRNKKGSGEDENVVNPYEVQGTAIKLDPSQRSVKGIFGLSNYIFNPATAESSRKAPNTGKQTILDVDDTFYYAGYGSPEGKEGNMLSQSYGKLTKPATTDAIFLGYRLVPFITKVVGKDGKIDSEKTLELQNQLAVPGKNGNIKTEKPEIKQDELGKYYFSEGEKYYVAENSCKAWKYLNGKNKGELYQPEKDNIINKQYFESCDNQKTVDFKNVDINNNWSKQLIVQPSAAGRLDKQIWDLNNAVRELSANSNISEENKVEMARKLLTLNEKIKQSKAFLENNNGKILTLEQQKTAAFIQELVENSERDAALNSNSKAEAAKTESQSPYVTGRTGDESQSTNTGFIKKETKQ
jgi:hypothetical protein